MNKAPQLVQRLTPLAEVLATVDRLVVPTSPYDIGVDSALGRTLAADVTLPEAHPAAALALRDGFAVRAEETFDAGSYAPALLSALPAAISAGQKLPAGADAVVPLDGVALSGGAAQALMSVAPGEGVLAAGADATAGTLLCRAGEKLRASDVAALRALGIGRVSIRAPQVRVLRARPGDDILDVAADWIGAAAAADGAIVTSYGWIGNDARHLHEALTAKGADAVVVVGGTGPGPADISVDTLRGAGRVEVHGVALAPGETAAFGMIGTRPVLLVPGRLDAVFAAYVTLGRRMLARLAVQTDRDSAVVAPLTRKVASRLGMTELVPVRRTADGVEPLASDYLPHAAVAQADGFILVPADSEGYPAGAQVAVRRLP
jgi:molybdopterin biosynthesis enzyme